jgi:hypothetical protein
MIKLSFGNKKLPKTTVIMNITSAKDCPSIRLGFCQCPKHCYARKAEVLYPDTLPSRREQTKFWDKNPALYIAWEIVKRIYAKKIRPDTFRFNEAGDFRNQDDVDKMTIICAELQKEFGMKCYGYTARSDLDFMGLRWFANVNGSGFMVTNKFVFVPKGQKARTKLVCNCDCRTCTMCRDLKGKIISVHQH